MQGMRKTQITTVRRSRVSGHGFYFEWIRVDTESIDDKSEQLDSLRSEVTLAGFDEQPVFSQSLEHLLYCFDMLFECSRINDYVVYEHETRLSNQVSEHLMHH